MTLREALNSAIHQLRTRKDIAEWASRDANLLLQHATGRSRTNILAHPEDALTREEQRAFNTLIERRLQATPIQYLTGKQEFYGREFVVTPDVLIPRPETELLIDEIKSRFPQNTTARITDVGTGSGILAVTLALEFPQARITAVDISPAALAIAQDNAARHTVAHRITFLESDLLEKVADLQDLIVSNPPYIGEEERASLHPQVREYEPSLALFAGREGNDIYRRLIPQAWEKLVAGGWLLLEIGSRNAELDSMFQGWIDLTYIRDLQQHPRQIAARKPPAQAR